ncbi:MAG: WD40 repeat domain-containing protein [Planctomycetes bacterium]|nr:WD40 repeat domain-containing protein [Planctomycetota bacterium]
MKSRSMSPGAIHLALIVAFCVGRLSAQEPVETTGRVFAKHPDRVETIALAKVGGFILGLDTAGRVIQWQLSSGKELGRHDVPRPFGSETPPGSTPPFLAVDAKGKSLAVLVHGVEPQLFKMFLGRKPDPNVELGIFRGARPIQVRRNRDDGVFTFIDDQQHVGLIFSEVSRDITSMQVALKVNETKTALTSLAVSKDGKWILVGDARGLITGFPQLDLETRESFAHHESAVGFLECHPKKAKFVSSTGSGHLAFWDIKKPEPTRLVPVEKRLTVLAYSLTGGLLATGLADGSIAIWNDKEDRPLATLKSPEFGVAETLVFGKGDHLFACGYGPSIITWDVKKAIAAQRRAR